MTGTLVITNGVITRIGIDVAPSELLARQDGDIGRVLTMLMQAGWRIVGDYEIKLEKENKSENH